MPQISAIIEASFFFCVEKSSHLESILYEIRSSYKKELMETGLAGQFHDFVLVANLLSDSLFIDLSVSGEEEEKADLSYVPRNHKRFRQSAYDR